ncbi:MAG: 2-amino-4-hydroxy-6-hydroxymethyldihydropteridine diphosphokinase, partial [Reinekea sp.]
ERSGPKFSPRTLDIDVVTYGEYSGVLDGVELPRPELFKNAFVLLPMADLWPDRLIPGQAVSYAKLWSEMASQQQVLHRVDLVRR